MLLVVKKLFFYGSLSSSCLAHTFPQMHFVYCNKTSSYFYWKDFFIFLPHSTISNHIPPLKFHSHFDTKRAESSFQLKITRKIFSERHWRINELFSSSHVHKMSKNYKILLSHFTFPFIHGHTLRHWLYAQNFFFATISELIFLPLFTVIVKFIIELESFGCITHKFDFCRIH